MGVLGWPPSEFWEASLHDLMPALDGYGEKSGARKEEATAMPPKDVGRGLAALLRGA